MTLLITGGAGYIGSHMAWLCYDQNIPFVVLDDLSTGYWDNLPPDTKLIIGDVADEALLKTLFKEHAITSIIHFAAKIVVPESVAHPLDYYRNNTAKACVMIDCAIKHGVQHFVFSSTAAVYGDAQSGLVIEGAPKSPTSPYGHSKLMVEQMLADAKKAHGLSFVVLRYFNVAGADPQGRTGQSNPQATHLIKLANLTSLGQRPQLLIYGDDYNTPDGTGIRDYIHVSDLVSAHLCALNYLQQGGLSLIANCGYGQGYSVRDVIAAVKEISGVDFPVRVTQRRAGDPASLVADATLARTILGWVPQFNDLKTIVRHALDWEKKITPPAH
jgi:UDP-glucose 4-epimerase